MARIGHAFSSLSNLTFHGDVRRFQTDFLSVKRELDNTHATITHLIMVQLMKSFEGKSKAVQFKNAEDFNKMDVNSPEINLYDMVQGYCADLATVGDSKPHVVGVVTCTVCQSDVHESAEWPAHKQLPGNSMKPIEQRSSVEEFLVQGRIVNHHRYRFQVMHI